MKAYAGLIPVVAAVLVALAGARAKAQTARAEDDCLTAPNGPAPQGSHWYYHADRATQRKCWYIRPQGQAVPEAVPQQTDAQETPLEATSPQEKPLREKPETPVPAPVKLGSAHARADSPGRAHAAGRPAGAHIAARADVPSPPSAKNAGAPAPSLGGAQPMAWPDPPAKTGADTTVWPDPPAKTGNDATAWPDPPATSVTDSTAGPQPPAAADPVAVESSPAKLQDQSGQAASGAVSASDQSVDQQPAAEAATRPSSGMPLGLALVGAIVLVIAGLYLRAIVTKGLRRSPTANMRRQKPVLAGSIDEGRMMPAFPEHLFEFAANNNEGGRRNDESVVALRKLLQILDRQAA